MRKSELMRMKKPKRKRMQQHEEQEKAKMSLPQLRRLSELERIAEKSSFQ